MRRANASAAIGYVLAEEVRYNERSAADALGIEGVTDHLRLDEDDDFRPRAVLAGVAEYVAEIFDLVEARYTGFVVVLLLADEAAEQHGLAARHRDRRVNAPLRNGRRQGLLIGIDVEISCSISSTTTPLAWMRGSTLRITPVDCRNRRLHQAAGDP